ncbi:unnamed protein product [Pseudo-nitzschia multistriata]|uniref:Uncharacterized protein n=1 Tax=Pseudo-nitzschia multistriata TaxID=183589 RepID=A0A448ZSJ9_9STRA|nr:unnamed protein product [Pseudo-nitzschia multistriata]
MSNLTLFRATDVAMSDGHNHVVRLQASSLSSAAAIVRAGLRKIHRLIDDNPLAAASDQTNRLPPSPCED